MGAAEIFVRGGMIGPPHEETVAKRPPHGEKVAKRPLHDEKGLPIRRKSYEKGPHMEKK